jgi:hypothetical protein
MVHLDQDGREVARNSGFSIGVGVGGGSYGHSGGTEGGVGATIPVGGGGPNLVISSHLSVRIQRRSDATVFWEGRAEMQARGGTEFAGKGPVANRLAVALFQDFPGSVALSGFDESIVSSAFDGGNIIWSPSKAIVSTKSAGPQVRFLSMVLFSADRWRRRALQLRILNCAGAALSARLGGLSGLPFR